MPAPPKSLRRPLRLPAAASAVVIAAVMSASACGGADEVPSSAYEGLDPGLVAEATVNANFVGRLADQPDDTKAGLAQGMVINFAVCRDLLRAYEQLVTVGTADPLPALPVPAEPDAFSYDWWVKDHASMAQSVRDRDIDAVRQWIAGDGSCGEWIPVSADSPVTIRDRVEELAAGR